MPGALQPRLSWNALWSYANNRGIRSIARLAELTGMDRRSFSRYRSSGEVNELAADRIAVALGDVPESIWGAQYADATAGMIERAEAEVQAQRARKAAVMRRYRASNPEYAQRQREKVERWKLANPDRVRRAHAEQQRRWRARQPPEFWEARRQYQKAYRERMKGQERTA